MKVFSSLPFLPLNSLIILGRKAVLISVLEAIKKRTSELPSKAQM
ncbi:hypothetical protein [Methanosarcina lacustris]|nr:hypothetical protein [Methanosarcina lacustris]